MRFRPSSEPSLKNEMYTIIIKTNTSQILMYGQTCTVNLNIDSCIYFLKNQLNTQCSRVVGEGRNEQS